MLIVISDLHLVDGTCGKPISASAFRLFAARLNELAFTDSWRSDKRYRPLDGNDILLLGDILDPLHSTLWLDKSPGEPGYVRPWTDIHAPEYAAKVHAITQAISSTTPRRLKPCVTSPRGSSSTCRLPPVAVAVR